MPDVDVYDLSKQVSCLQESLGEVFIREFNLKLSTALDSVNKKIQNVEVTDFVDTIDKFFVKITNSSFVDDANMLMNRMAKVSDKVDNEDVKKIFHDYNLILKDAVDNRLIDTLSSQLDSVNTLTNLEKYFNSFFDTNAAKSLMILAPFGGLFAASIAMYKERKQTQMFTKMLDEMKNNNRVSIEALRAQSFIQWGTARLVEVISSDKLSPEDKRLLEQAKHEAKRKIDNLSVLSLDTLKSLSSIASQYDALIKNLHSLESGQTLEKLLDRFTLSDVSSAKNWDKLLKYVIYGKVEKINYNLRAISYEFLVHEYGEDKIKPIMKLLSKAFAEHGGNKLFYNICGFMNEAPKSFMDIIKYIPAAHLKIKFGKLSDDNKDMGFAVEELAYFYHDKDGARKVIDVEWRKFMADDDNLQHLSVDSEDAIILRAFLEYCKTTASYLFLPYNIKRGVMNNASYIAQGAVNVVSHRTRGIYTLFDRRHIIPVQSQVLEPVIEAPVFNPSFGRL